MKLGVLASGNLGLQVLKSLFSNHVVTFIATDKASQGIVDFANDNKTLLFKGNPRQGKSFNAVGTTDIDVLVSVNYLFLIEEDLMSLPRKMAINIHGSLLPKYRGRTPHVWAIINGEKKSGITVHEITSGCDEGNIIEQLTIPIEDHMTGGELLSLFSQNYTPLITKALLKIEQDQIKFVVQNEKEATYFGKRTPEDGKIDWNWSKERITNWVRAQAYPYPGAFTFVNGQKLIIDQVKNSDCGFHYKDINGTVLSEEPLVVKTATGALEIVKVRNHIKANFKQILK